MFSISVGDETQNPEDDKGWIWPLSSLMIMEIRVKKSTLSPSSVVNKYLLNAYCVTHTVLCARHAVMPMANKVPATVG